MANSTSQSSPGIAPPLLIIICIIGAVVAVIVTAALYKLCRRATADVIEDVNDKSWNPNQRHLEQTRYMEEVRMRNKMFAWERARRRKRDLDGAEEGWFGGRDGSKEVLVEEYLDDIALNDNPYEGVVDECVRRQSHQMLKQSPRKFHQPFQGGEEVVQRGFGTAVPESAVPLGEGLDHGVNNSGVKITVNDEVGDLADGEEAFSSKWPPRRSRIFRSSSLYSGDVLLPSTHLHLVQSSSSYAFGKSGGRGT